MCIVTEHARLRRDYNTLKAENDKVVAQMMELTKSPPMPVTDLLKIDRNEYLKKLLTFGITPVGDDDPLDSWVSLASMAELERLAPDICYPADWYVTSIFDCENYAAQAENDAARFFHVSGICRVLGDMPLGYHGFVATLDKDNLELWILEPNAGFDYSGGWCRPGEIDYKPKKIYI